MCVCVCVCVCVCGVLYGEFVIFCRPYYFTINKSYFTDALDRFVSLEHTHTHTLITLVYIHTLTQCICSALFRNLRFLEKVQRLLGILRKRGLSRESAALSRESAVTESATDTALSKV